MSVGPWLHKSCLGRVENTLAFISMSANFVSDKLCTYSHVQSNIVPNSNQRKRVFTPTVVRCLMIVHEDIFQHCSRLVDIRFIGLRRGTSQLKLRCKVNSEPAFESSLFRGLVSDLLEEAVKSLPNPPRSSQLQVALACSTCLLLPFEQHVQRDCEHR